MKSCDFLQLTVISDVEYVLRYCDTNEFIYSLQSIKKFKIVIAEIWGNFYEATRRDHYIGPVTKRLLGFVGEIPSDAKGKIQTNDHWGSWFKQ